MYSSDRKSTAVEKVNQQNQFSIREWDFVFPDSDTFKDLTTLTLIFISKFKHFQEEDVYSMTDMLFN